jgi:hypothetical protein
LIPSATLRSLLQDEKIPDGFVPRRTEMDIWGLGFWGWFVEFGGLVLGEEVRQLVFKDGDGQGKNFGESD